LRVMSSRPRYRINRLGILDEIILINLRKMDRRN